MYIYVCVCTYVCVCVYVYMCVYIQKKWVLFCSMLLTKELYKSYTPHTPPPPILNFHSLILLPHTQIATHIQELALLTDVSDKRAIILMPHHSSSLIIMRIHLNTF